MRKSVVRLALAALLSLGAVACGYDEEDGTDEGTEDSAENGGAY